MNQLFIWRVNQIKKLTSWSRLLKSPLKPATPWKILSSLNTVNFSQMSKLGHLSMSSKLPSTWPRLTSGSLRKLVPLALVLVSAVLITKNMITGGQGRMNRMVLILPTGIRSRQESKEAAPFPVLEVSIKLLLKEIVLQQNSLKLQIFKELDFCKGLR